MMGNTINELTDGQALLAEQLERLAKRNHELEKILLLKQETDVIANAINRHSADQVRAIEKAAKMQTMAILLASSLPEYRELFKGKSLQGVVLALSMMAATKEATENE